VTDRSHEDVSFDVARELAEGRMQGSRLAWADFVRNSIVMEQVRRAEPVTLLDVGCGSSLWLMRWIVEAGLDTKYIGLDADEARVERLKRHRWRGTKPRRRPEGVVHDAEKPLPFPTNELGMVTCLEAMEHFVHDTTSTFGFIEEVARVLLPGGIFLLATPNKGLQDELQHPHCHGYESAHIQVRAALRKHFRLDWWASYRMRPHLVEELDPDTRYLKTPLPKGLLDVMSAIEHTQSQELQPAGNVLYIAVLPYSRRHQGPGGTFGDDI